MGLFLVLVVLVLWLLSYGGLFYGVWFGWLVVDFGLFVFALLCLVL